MFDEAAAAYAQGAAGLAGAAAVVVPKVVQLAVGVEGEVEGDAVEGGEVNRLLGAAAGRLEAGVIRAAPVTCKKNWQFWYNS